jgi:hypothetical protein
VDNTYTFGIHVWHEKGRSKGRVERAERRKGWLKRVEGCKISGAGRAASLYFGLAGTLHVTQSNSKTKNIDWFSRYLNVQSTASATQSDIGQCSSSKSTDNSIKSTCTNLNVLSKIFTDDIPIDSDQNGGLLLDEAQIKLLENSWRSLRLQKGLHVFGKIIETVPQFITMQLVFYKFLV